MMTTTRQVEWHAVCSEQTVERVTQIKDTLPPESHHTVSKLQTLDLITNALSRDSLTLSPLTCTPQHAA